ncbi:MULTISPECIES: hypothetical protein [unclassified Microcella]|uniref:hypothetical protein n=1 Tax=unclassified Microcella TaxID=2630066 RepID=UPI0006F8A59F|nr:MULTISPECIES: hypothetical protein [unclassified Microcella]KQV24984.1 hypothetical protein ASC54_10955 [Yonghaparkia sp. Root332]KRF31269.1 hypothetical protein ASG83_10765 [Yonghaparkia sp. Soil809]
MRNAVWLVIGITIGFFAAHRVEKSPQGRQFLDEVDAKARGFGEAVLDGYRQREAELRAAVAEAEATIADLERRS